MWTDSKLQTQGAATDATILQVSTAKDPSKYQLRIGVRYDDGTSVEFAEELANYFDLPLPDVRGTNGLVNASFAPPPTKVPAQFSVGQPIRVRYAPDHRQKVVIDWSAVRTARCRSGRCRHRKVRNGADCTRSTW
jgi:hypothetical protein